MVPGIKVARSYRRLLYGTWEPVAPMPREKSKGQIPKDESTDAENRGGAVRTSDEVPVMGIEGKGTALFGFIPQSTGNGRNR